MELKELWKRLPYWLKGALITSVSMTMLIIYDLIFTKGASKGHLTLMMGIFTLLWPLFWFFEHDHEAGAFTIFIIMSFIHYFILGAIIGLIVKKIKSKKKI